MTSLATLTTTDTTRPDWFNGVAINDKTLAATLELIYLRPLLTALPRSHKTALDVGAHRGEVTGELLNNGFRVLAVEPQDFLADHLQSRFAAEVARGRLHIQRCAASDRVGKSQLFVGSASTVSSLEEEWTTVAFPAEFRSPRRVVVPLCTAGELLARRGWVTVGFAKVDVEGHELPALQGLFNHPAAAGATASPPAVVMFEANHCFPDRAEACLDLLRSKGYRTFDLFVRRGIDPIAGERSTQPGLPPAWRGCGVQNFYANLIAYHDKSPVKPNEIDPAEFVRAYNDCKAAAQEGTV